MSIDTYHIKFKRKTLNLTQYELSQLLGVSERNYRSKELGKVPFSQIEILKLIDIFKLDNWVV